MFHSVEPAWNDRNLRELSGHIRSPLVFAHIRASTGTPVQQTNCHPFRHGRWLWMHNGLIAQFHDVKRELVLAVDPSLYPRSRARPTPRCSSSSRSPSGSRTTRRAPSQRAVGLIEEVGRRHGVEHPIQMTVATSDGDAAVGVPVLERGPVALAVLLDRGDTLRDQYPDNPVLHGLSDETRLVVSEPLGDLAGAWNEVPESSYGVIQEGEDVLRPFTPRHRPDAGRTTRGG